jgi:hypothetical protein
MKFHVTMLATPEVGLCPIDGAIGKKLKSADICGPAAPSGHFDRGCLIGRANMYGLGAGGQAHGGIHQG